MLLKKQRNALLEVLQKNNFKASDFTERNEDAEYDLELKGTDFGFYIEEEPGGYRVAGLPKHAGLNTGKFGSIIHWDRVIEHINEWAIELREEIETPDLWADALGNADFLNENNDLSEDKFTEIEINEIKTRLGFLEQKLIGTDIPDDAKEGLTETLSSAPQKAELFTKKDWKDWIVGNVMRQIFNLTLTQEHANTVWTLFKTAFSTLFLH